MSRDPRIQTKIDYLFSLLYDLPEDERKLDEAMRPVINAACDIQCEIYRIWRERAAPSKLREIACRADDILDLINEINRSQS